METNTTILSLERYNELYDLEKNIKDGKSLVIYQRFGFGGGNIDRYFYTNDEIAEKLKAEIDKLQKELDKANDELARREKKVCKIKELTLDDVRQMSYWEFRKWRQQ